MKISKQTVTAKSSNSNPISKAVEHIQCAITLLGDNCKDDKVAREALINLGVVAADLNSSNSSRR